MAINILSWITPAFTSILLGALRVDVVDYANIFGMIASSSIEIGSCAMCPALYAIKFPICKQL
jgi:hypothetical protein